MNKDSDSGANKDISSQEIFAILGSVLILTVIVMGTVSIVIYIWRTGG